MLCGIVLHSKLTLRETDRLLMPMAANSLSFGLPCDVYVSKLFVYSEDRQTIVVRGTFLRVLGTELFSETAEETRRLRAKPCNGQAPEAMARIIGSLEPIRKQNANTFPFSSTTPIQILPLLLHLRTTVAKHSRPSSGCAATSRLQETMICLVSCAKSTTNGGMHTVEGRAHILRALIVYV